MPPSDTSTDLLSRLGAILQELQSHEARFLYGEIEAHMQELERRALPPLTWKEIAPDSFRAICPAFTCTVKRCTWKDGFEWVIWKDEAERRYLNRGVCSNPQKGKDACFQALLAALQAPAAEADSSTFHEV